MTQKQQRIAIAEACGWKPYSPGDFNPTKRWINNACEVRALHGYLHDEKCVLPLPDYLNDLNAMHEAEQTLTHDEWRIFIGFLMGERIIPKLASMEEFHRAWHATAAQRAEAFLRTVGKWVEKNC